jgi:hypothetical protein
MLNIVMISQPQLLSSTVAKNPVFRINRFIRSQPPGFPLPTISEPVSFPDVNAIFLHEYKEPLRSFFNKKIALNASLNNPTILRTYSELLRDSGLVSELKHFPFIYLADSLAQLNNRSFTKRYLLAVPDTSHHGQNSSVSLTSFSPNRFDVSVGSDRSNFLVILQNNFTSWKANIGSKRLPIETVNHSFMGIKIPPGSYTLTLKYEPAWFIPGLILSLTGLVLTVFFLIVRPHKIVSV